jgi:hypothetical protein
MRVLLAIAILELSLGCRSDTTYQPSQKRESLRKIAAETPVTMVPPRAARFATGVPYIVLLKGFGKVRPELGKGLLVGVSFIVYDSSGEIKSETPFVLQDLDSSKTEWKAALCQMVAGEVRRIWIRENARQRVYDVQLLAIGSPPKR